MDGNNSGALGARGVHNAWIGAKGPSAFDLRSKAVTLGPDDYNNLS
jgi:hypothetical protein